MEARLRALEAEVQELRARNDVLEAVIGDGAPANHQPQELRVLRAKVARHEALFAEQQRALDALTAQVRQLRPPGRRTTSPPPAERRPQSAKKRRPKSPSQSSSSPPPSASSSLRYAIAGRQVSVHPPTGWTPPDPATRPGAAPDMRLELDHVYGYRAAHPTLNLGNPIVIVSPDVIAYPAAALVVVLDSASNVQRFFAGHTDDVLALDVAPTAGSGGRPLACSAQLGKKPAVIIWALDTCEPVVTLPDTAHDRGVAHVAFSHDGARLATMGLDPHRTIVVWDWRHRAPLANAKGHNDAVHALRFSPLSSDVLAIACARAFKLFQAERPAERQARSSSSPALLSTPLLLLNRRNGVFGRQGTARDGQPQTLLSLVFGADGHAFTGCAGGDVLVWWGSEVVRRLDGMHEAAVRGVAVTPGGLLVSADVAGRLVAWDDGGRGRVVAALDDGGAAPGVAFLAAAGDAGVLAGCVDGAVREVALPTGEVEVWVQAHGLGELWGLAAHPTEALRFASCSDDRTVRVWAADQRWPLACCTLSEQARSIDWRPDGTHLAVGLGNGSVLVLAAETLEPAGSARRSEAEICDVRWSPDGRFLAAASHDATITIFDASLNAVGACRGHSAAVRHLDWATSSAALQSASADHELLFWAMPKGSRLDAAACRDVDWATWTCHVGWPVRGIWQAGMDGTDINDVAWCPEAAVVAAADDYGKVRVLRWPCVKAHADAQEVAGHASHVTRVRWLRGGNRLVSAGGGDHCIMQWRVGGSRRSHADPGGDQLLGGAEFL